MITGFDPFSLDKQNVLKAIRPARLLIGIGWTGLCGRWGDGEINAAVFPVRYPGLRRGGF